MASMPKPAGAPRLAELHLLARRCGVALVAAGMRLACAESCTGGLIAASCTGVAGSSAWFEGAFVTYQLAAKSRVLGVSELTLQRWGAVSEPTAREMAIGALNHCDAEIAVSATGIAGPTGGDIIHPLGTVWFAWALRVPDGVRVVQTARHEFTGARNSIRRAAVATALQGVLSVLSPV
jgi:nicotinamide-nucleotide amidase